ncbi:site-specific integrase [Listeria fleischmannii]|uniref:site-specific integrase n=1 Tax=Listeria fleischmannii TaxID=1069827 RepID=UPI0004ADF5DA|nr:site-specific integrase [Listeria fleischmannii]
MKTYLKTKAQFMQTDKVKLLIEELQQFHSISRGVIFMSIQTGMRFEEIVAITKKDIDFNKHILTVNKAWDYKHTHTFIETKNKSTRTIYLDKFTTDYLKGYIQWHDNYLKEHKLANKLMLLFYTYHNKPIDNASCNKALKKICHKIKKRKCHTPQAKTHAYGLCVEAGMDIIYVADRLGHEDINTTLKYYSHLSDSIRSNNQVKIDQFFNYK